MVCVNIHVCMYVVVAMSLSPDKNTILWACLCVWHRHPSVLQMEGSELSMALLEEEGGGKGTQVK